MGVWCYCPRCYKLADKASLLRSCPFGPCLGAKLVVLPLDPEAAQAALKLGGAKALREMIVALVAGEEAVEAYCDQYEAEEDYWERASSRGWGNVKRVRT